MLIAPPDCDLLARQGWLVTESGVYSFVVVDCADDQHRELWRERGLLVDCNRKDLVHQYGWLIVR